MLLKIADVDLFEPLYEFAKTLYGFGSEVFRVFGMSLGKIAEAVGFNELPSGFYNISLLQFTFSSLSFVVGWIIISWIIDVLP